MTAELIQTTPEFHDLKDEWNALLDKSASRVPFLRHEFLASWWETLGGGEWAEGNLAVIAVRDPAGTLIGIAPFFIHNQRVLLIGSYEISDYLDIISLEEQRSGVIEEVMACLDDPEFPAWKRIELFNLLEDSPSLPPLRAWARGTDRSLEEAVLQPAPYIPLPGSWRSYLEDLKPKYRREIERKLTNADQYFLPVSWYIAEDPAALDAELDSFLELMGNHPEKKQFLTQEMVQQIKGSAQEAFQAGWLQLAFLQVGDVKAAGYLNFDFNNQIWIYNSGINPLFENLSPGWVLLGRIIEWAIGNSREKVDFMRGDETYKYQFGGVDKQVIRLVISK